MAYLEIQGGCKLQGEITPQGAKNEAMQILCACLLTEDKVTIHNLPNILDINNLIVLLKGMCVTIEHLTEHDITLEAKSINFKYFDTKEYKDTASKLRGSVMMVGPLLARFGEAYMPKPGGDKIGRRKLDTHEYGLEKLGARFVEHSNKVVLEKERLEGCYIHLSEDCI